MKYDELSTSKELISYLCDYKSRLQNIKVLSQYTRLSAILGILESGYWIINNPERMNDLFEYKMFNNHSALPVWDSVFFASFTPEENESVAMWSMYGQPWEDGIRVSIPKDVFIEWVSNIDCVYSADPITKKIDSSKCLSESQIKISIARVAYNDSKRNQLLCANKANEIIRNPYASPELAGYVKDSAWEYEREIRLRVDLLENSPVKCIAIKVPDYVLSRITILKGPRYSNRDVLLSIPRRYKPVINIFNSELSEKIGWIPCDDCKTKRSPSSLIDTDGSFKTDSFVSRTHQNSSAKFTEKSIKPATLMEQENTAISECSLASGDSTTDIVFCVFNIGETNYNVDSISVTMSWNDILKQIGPCLLEENIRYTITESLLSIGRNEYFNYLGNENRINHFKEKQYMHVSETSIGEILVQFMALNYIEVHHPNHNNDFELSHESTYVLTELGRKTLFSLSAKKKG